MSTIFERLRVVREESELNQADMADRLEVSRSYLSEVLSGKHKPSIEMIVGISKNFREFDIDWLLTGEGPMRRDDCATQQTDLTAMNGWVPLLDLAASAGAGTVVYHEDQKGWIGFDPMWLWENYKLRPTDLTAMAVDGQSMEPTLQNGEVILVRVIKDGEFKDGIHVVRFEGVLLVKHVQRMPGGKVLLVSEHPSYRPTEINMRDESTDFAVLGRVVMKLKTI